MGDDYVQHTAIGQLRSRSSPTSDLGVVFVSTVTGLILFLAANTAFNGFPVLGSILAKDGYLPRQLHTRGDRLAFSNGILILAAAAMFLVVVFRADVNALLQLYIVGVFVSFTTSQTGMVRHWTRNLRLERDRTVRRRMQRSRVINGLGAVMCALVLLVVLITKFQAGAALRHPRDGRALRAHAGHQEALRPGQPRSSPSTGSPTNRLLPSHVHAIVCISKVHKPTMRALSYARASRPSMLEAVTVDVDPDETHALRGGVGETADPRPAQGPGVALPLDHATDPRLRALDPAPATRGTS